MSTSAYRFSNAAIVCIVIISIVLIYFFRWSGDGLNSFKNSIDGDGRDYYSYLISVFINKNLGQQDATHYYVIQTATGTINQHTVGESVLLLPFFGIAYLWALIKNAPLDGFSEPFQKMVSIAALFNFIVGLYYLKRLLVELFFKDKIIAIVLLLIFLGTNLLNYAVYQPSMSHVYSFSLIAAFLFYAKKCFDQLEFKNILPAAFILGLITLVRPINGIIVLSLPFFANSLQHFIATAKIFFCNKKSVVVSLIVYLSTISVQSIIWYFQNGQVLQWSYKNAGFYFLNPQMRLMLFGFNSGFFIYTPLCFIILFGLIPLFGKSHFKFFSLALFLLFVFYLFSSFWGYTYWDGISIRPLVEYYPLFAILLAILLTSLSARKIKFAAYLLISVAVFFNIVFCYQFQAGILPPAGMNANKFKYIFLKTDKAYADILGGCMDMQPYAKQIPKVSYSLNHTQQFVFNQKEFGLDFNIDSLPFSTNQLYIKIKLKRKEETLNASSNAFIVVSAESKNGITKNYQAYKLNDTPSSACCQWQEYMYAIEMGAKLIPGDKLKIYIWNKNKQQFSVMDYSVEVYNYNFKT